MKAIGYVRQIDKLGRLVLPSDIRKSLEITDGEDSVEFFMDDDSIIIRKYHPSCVFCNSDEDVIIYKGRRICHACLEDLRNTK